MFFKKNKPEMKYVYIVMRETLGRRIEDGDCKMFDIRLITPDPMKVFYDYDEAKKWLINYGNKILGFEDSIVESNGFDSWFSKIRSVPGNNTMQMRTHYWIVERTI